MRHGGKGRLVHSPSPSTKGWTRAEVGKQEKREGVTGEQSELFQARGGRLCFGQIKIMQVSRYKTGSGAERQSNELL